MDQDQIVFDVLTAANKDTLSQEGKFCQLWGVIITKVSVIGNQNTFGIAINENLILNVIIPDEHPFLMEIRDMGDEVIGKYT